MTLESAFCSDWQLADSLLEKLKGKLFNMSILVIYALRSESVEEEVDRLYNTLSNAKKNPKKLVIMMENPKCKSRSKLDKEMVRNKKVVQLSKTNGFIASG